MDSAISHVVSHNTTTFSILHDQVHGKVFDKEDTVISQCTAKECVEHRVSSSVGNSAATIGLTTFAELCGLASEGSLVNFSIGSTTKWHTVAFKFTDCNWGLSCHVMDGVLVSKPVTALHSVVEMVLPAVFVHVSKSCINSTLSSNCMGTSREELRDASSFESSLRKPESSPESSTTSADNNRIILVIDNLIISNQVASLSNS